MTGTSPDKILEKLGGIKIVGGEHDGLTYSEACTDPDVCAKAARTRAPDKASLKSFASAMLAVKKLQEEVGPSLPSAAGGAVVVAANSAEESGVKGGAKKIVSAVPLSRRLRPISKLSFLGFKMQGDVQDLSKLCGSLNQLVKSLILGRFSYYLGLLVLIFVLLPELLVMLLEMVVRAVAMVGWVAVRMGFRTVGQQCDNALDALCEGLAYVYLCVDAQVGYLLSFINPWRNARGTPWVAASSPAASWLRRSSSSVTWVSPDAVAVQPGRGLLETGELGAIGFLLYRHWHPHNGLAPA